MDTTQASRLAQALRQNSHATAESWYQAVAQTSFVPLSVAQVRQQIAELTEQAITLLCDESFDHDKASAIGASLARLGYLQPEALAGTQQVLTRQLVQDLPVDLVVTLQPKLAELVGRVAGGFSQAALAQVLAEQEEIRSALIAGRQRAENALRESEARYRILVETSPDAVTLVHRDGTILFCNQQAAELHGYADIQEISGKSAFDLIDPSGRQRAIDAARKIAETGLVRNGEYTLLRKDGSTFPAEFSSSLVTDAEGQPQAFISVVRDITERKRAEQSEREQRALAEALRDTSAALSSTLDFEKVLDHILVNLDRVVPHDTANFMLVDPSSGEVFVTRHKGYAERGLEESVRNLRFSIANTPSLRQMADTHRSLIVPDTQADATWIPAPGFGWIRSYAGVPILTKGTLVGFLNLTSATPDFFTPAHAERLQAFAHQAAVAIDNAHLYEATRRSVERLLRLHEAGEALALAGSVDELYREIVRRAGQLVGANASILTLFDGKYLVAVAVENLSDSLVGTRVGLGEGVSGRAAQSRAPRYVRNYTQLDRRQRAIGAEGLPFVGVAALPLIWQDRLVGTLTITDNREREFDDEDVHVLTSFATLAAAALEQRRAVSEIQASEVEARTLTARLARVQEEERARIAAQLHDSVSHRLVTLQKNTEYLQAQVPPDDALQQQLGTNAALLQETNQMLSSLAMDLDIKQLDDLGLDPVARRYVERLCVADCRISLRVTGRVQRLPREVERVAFRVLQEGLTSIVQHAQATRISSRLHFGLKSLRLTVQVNGRRFAPDALESDMASRLADLRRQTQALEGKLTVESAPGTGAVLTLHLPFRIPASAQSQIPVILVEGHDVIRHGLRLALTESGEFTCVGEATEGLVALHQIELSQPEVVLIDVRLPGASGIEITRQIAKRFPHVRVVVLSYTADETYLEQALQAGARGFLLVTEHSRQIASSLHAVLQGEFAISPAMTDAWVRLRARSIREDSPELVTSREREVLSMIIAGYSSQMIANEMGISRRTVEVHRRNLKAKLKTKNSAQMIEAALRLGLISLKA